MNSAEHLALERIHHCDPCRRIVARGARRDREASNEGGRRNLEVRSVMADLRRETTPDARRRGVEGDDAVRELQAGPVEPVAEHVARFRVAPRLEGDAAGDLADGRRADEERPSSCAMSQAATRG